MLRGATSRAEATATSQGRRRLAACEGSDPEGGEIAALIYDGQAACLRLPILMPPEPPWRRARDL
jgi:hypothetical protein